jgi:acyl-coenzyme A thioesterase PaaI-like protein
MKGTDHFRELLGIKVHETKDGYAKLSLKIVKEHLNCCGFYSWWRCFLLWLIVRLRKP